MNRSYYAAHSYMGINYTYDSPCWQVYVFADRRTRDEWVAKNEYNNGNLVAQTVTRREAEKIAPDLRKGIPPHECWRVIVVSD